MRSLLLAPLLVLPLLLGGCAESEPSADRSDPAVPVATASPGSSTAPSAAPTAVAESPIADTATTAVPTAAAPTEVASSGAVRSCSGPALDIALRSSDSGAGSTDYTIAFTNRGATACQVSGAPRVDVIGADGNPIGPEATGTGAEGPLVRLASGQSATVVVRAVNVRSGGGPLADRCTPRPGVALAVDAPNYGRYEQLRTDVWGCAEADVPVLTVTTLRRSS